MKRVKSLEFLTPKSRQNLNAASTNIKNLTSALGDEEDEGLKETYGHYAMGFEEQYQDLNARYAESRRHGADPGLKEDSKILKKRTADAYQEYSDSSETKRKEREAQAREKGRKQERQQRQKQAKQAEFERQNDANWDALNDEYDSREESHIHGHPLPVPGAAPSPRPPVYPPAFASHSSPNLSHQSRSVQYFPSHHPMAGQPIVGPATPIMGRESMEEYDRAPAIPSLPPPRRPPRNPSDPRPARTRQPRGPPTTETYRSVAPRDPPQFGGNQLDYMQTRAYASHYTPEPRENQNFNMRQGSGHAPYASTSTSAVNHRVQYPPHANYQPTPNYNPPQGGSNYSQPRASGSGSGPPAHAQNPHFQGSPSSNFNQQPPSGYRHPNNPYGQGYHNYPGQGRG
ncbi:hypothetical protein B0H16DRAFT_1560607 [Mycena metata]|uniref:Uncharacterized protein n=1 Tax=Mycena metata TaxID=1033252 RepID=A0AAD7N385_9AGAR|nr:hypothetical protein B0H16DRAFT_1560607 [Mycena metata]